MLKGEISVKTLLEITENFPRVHGIKDPFYVLISTVLSQRTRDANMNEASRALFERFPNAFELSKAEIQEVERLVRPAGMYKQKAERVVRIAREIVGQWSGIVPNTLEELVKLKGVGRKTANIVLAVSYGIPAIAVDVHVHRISNRLGIVSTSKPEETEKRLMEILPKDRWTNLNGAMVNFGQTVCTPRNPRCSTCMFREVCEYGRRNKSGVSENEKKGSGS